jgi:hypothetical protein
MVIVVAAMRTVIGVLVSSLDVTGLAIFSGVFVAGVLMLVVFVLMRMPMVLGLRFVHGVLVRFVMIHDRSF